MLNKNQILKSIFTGWENVTEFIINTQDEENNYHFKPEYLITVKIAESIKQYLSDTSLLGSYSILLEEKTSRAMTRREEEVIEYYKSSIPKKLRLSTPTRNCPF